MRLMINGRPHDFIPIQIFRARWNLPDDFGVAHFEPKDWQGLGALTGSGEALARMRQGVIEAVPPVIRLFELLAQVEASAQLFRRELEAANVQIGLRQVEVDFAAAGFQDVMQSIAYHLIQLAQTYRADLAQLHNRFDFAAIYQAWLEASTRISATTHRYPPEDNGRQFEVRLVYNAYGRIGLAVGVANEAYYVADTSLACPAANYMADLCQAVALAWRNSLLQGFQQNGLSSQ